MSKTVLGACHQDDCVNNNREEDACKLPEITIGMHKNNKEGCMQFALDFDYLREGWKYERGRSGGW